MMQTSLENGSNLQSHSDDTLSSLKDSNTMNRTYRDAQQSKLATAALSLKTAQNYLNFHEKNDDVDFDCCCDSEISFVKKQQTLLSNTRLLNDHDSLSSTTSVNDEYDDIESQTSTRAVSEGELFDDDITVKRSNKIVRFGNATVREYCVTVGALSATREPCPLQLSWEYDSLETRIDINAYESFKQNSKMNSVRESFRHLSLDERRQRIANVQDISLYDVQSLEFQAMMDQIKNDNDNTAKLRQMENNEDTDSEEAC